MMEEGRKRGLGRGLSALLQEGGGLPLLPETRRGTHEVPIDRIRPNRAQPRRRFDDAELAGPRRWRAAQKAGVHTMPVVVRDVSDAQALQLALIENLQRQDLTALEEAEAYRQLVDEMQQTQEDVARAIGKSRSHVANTLRLLALPPEVQAMLQDGRLSAGHARALVGREDAAELAARIAAQGLNVRQAERLVRPDRKPRDKPAPAAVDPNVTAFERGLSEALGLKVEVREQGDGGGELRIHYSTLEQLDEVARRLGRGRAAE
jgi:ParB family chromosome partitioning protein